MGKVISERKSLALLANVVLWPHVVQTPVQAAIFTASPVPAAQVQATLTGAGAGSGVSLPQLLPQLSRVWGVAKAPVESAARAGSARRTASRLRSA